MIKQSEDSKMFCNSLNFNENFIELGVRCAKPCSPGTRLTAEQVFGFFLEVGEMFGAYI